MNPVYEKLMTCLKSVQEKVSFQPEVALILGSGLGDYADEIRVEQTVDYNTIEGFPVSTVAGHKFRLRLCGECACGHHAGPCPLL